MSTKVRPHRATGYALHRGALMDAGFAEVDTVWQYWHNRMIVGLKRDGG